MVWRAGFVGEASEPFTGVVLSEVAGQFSLLLRSRAARPMRLSAPETTPMPIAKQTALALVRYRLWLRLAGFVENSSGGLVGALLPGDAAVSHSDAGDSRPGMRCAWRKVELWFQFGRWGDC